MKDNQKQIYTIATAHLDTSWLWTFEKTIAEYLPRTVYDNVKLFEKYPDYKFNFEGSYRYELLEEYYPDLFKKVKEYVAKGQWNPCGSCYENGDVNTPSPEALWRNILYGNSYFEDTFGKPTTDIFLPDCFGFGKALPSVAAHAGLTGFSTAKLTWGCGEDIPFDIGRWKGIDGNEVFAAIKPGAYTTSFSSVRNNAKIQKKLKTNKANYGLDSTFVYHGTGDRGGAPAELSVKTVMQEMKKNAKSDTIVRSASTQEFFSDLSALPQHEKDMLPTFDGEFLLTEHGVGSYTSRTASKRWNRRCELLADAAERNTSAAFSLGLCNYPQDTFDRAWKRVIAHQFHDDITGTSFQECYRRNWNDYVQSMNVFSDEYTSAVQVLANEMDTSFAKGYPVVVSNPVQCIADRVQTVCARIPNPKKADFARVFDSDGKEVYAQIAERSNGFISVLFSAKVPSNGLRVYDIQLGDKDCRIESNPIKVTADTLENERYFVRLNQNGDIERVFDKALKKELLSAPVRIALHDDVNSKMWPAWEIKWEDLRSPAVAYANKPEIRITGFGPARGSVEITRTIGNSVFRQTLSLDAHGGFLKVENETDWQHEASFCKIEFPLANKNAFAEYDTGIGTAKRATNTQRLFEVPAQRFAGIRDTESDFCIAVLSDSRCGWDKPDENTLRLTCVHTPLSAYRWECSQHLMDFGLNRYNFGIFGCDTGIQQAADEFCQPMHTFVTNAHSGNFGTVFSFARLNNDTVRISCIKKAHKSDSIIVRMVETQGIQQKDLCLSFCTQIQSAALVNGCEKHLKDVDVTDGNIHFEMNANEIKTFSLQLEKQFNEPPIASSALQLPYNAVAVTDNDNRAKSTLPSGISVPKEILPDEILRANKVFRMQKDGYSAVQCAGQIIELPDGCETVSFLLTSLNGDSKAVFKVGDTEKLITVCDHAELVGTWDLIAMGETGYIKSQPLGFTATHTHYAEGDMIAKQFYLFKADIATFGVKTITLPDNKNILIFAASTDNGKNCLFAADDHFDRLTKRPYKYLLSERAVKKTAPNKLESRVMNLYEREKVFYGNFGFGAMALERAQLYYSVKSILNPEKKDKEQ